MAVKHKKMKKEFRVGVGISLARTTCDNGCGVHADKRTQRNRTRQQKNLHWQKDHGVR